MRLLFGIVIGIGLTVGAAFFHDNNIASDPLNPRLTNQPVVNWEVLGAVMRESTDWLGGVWRNITRK